MGALKVKEIHALSGEILQLEEKLSLAKARLNILLGITEAERKPRSGSLEGMRAKVVAWIEENWETDHPIKDIAASIGADELEVGKALYNSFKKGRIANPSRGRYKAIGGAVPEHLKSEKDGLEGW